MRLLLMLTAVAGLAGCGTTPAVSVPQLPEPFELLAWPRVTPKPVVVNAQQWFLCRPPTAEETKQRGDPAAKHGPHAGTAILVKVNPDGHADFLAVRPADVGTTVVKEKYADARDTSSPDAYAAMMKREPGYYPAGGDWEYAYVRLKPEPATERGRLANCAGCHAKSPTGDYLFRKYGASE